MASFIARKLFTSPSQQTQAVSRVVQQSASKKKYSVDSSLSPEEQKKKAWAVSQTWRRTMIPGFIGLGIFMVLQFTVMHEHGAYPPVEYKYNHLRNRLYPWGDGQSTLFGIRPKELRGDDGGHH